MNISPGLIAKGTAGALATTTAIGGGIAAKEGYFGDLFGKNVEPTVATEGEPEITEVIAPGDPAKSITDIGSGDRGLSHEPKATEDNSHLGVTEPTNGPVENGVDTTIISGDSESSQKQVQDSEEDGDKEEKAKLTKFDKELIKWLEATDKDVVFSVKEGDKNEEISGFSSLDSAETEIKISVEVNDDSKNLKGSGSKTGLKKLNEDKNWIWICEMKFKKGEESNSVNSINSEHRDRIYGAEANDEKGLFKKLMKDVTSDGNSKNLKEIKKNFIKKCARARDETEREEIEKGASSDGREIKTSKERIVFTLAKGEAGSAWGNNVNELYFKEKDKLNEWFSKKNN